MESQDLERYARHLVLREIGGQGQQRLNKARLLCVGAGGLGAPALLYLAAAGVGTLGIVDDDCVSLSNLQRQILYHTDQIGIAKTQMAKAALEALNPSVKIIPYRQRLGAQNAAVLFDDYDLILDGSDNYATRYVVNAAARKAGKPLISGAIGQWDGQLSVFISEGPCYACLHPKPPAEGLAPNCAEAGVIGALPGVIGSLMAMEAIKIITQTGVPLVGQVLLYDALNTEMRRIKFMKNSDCSVCGVPETLKY